MLCDSLLPELSELDQQIYQKVVPAEHYLRKALQVIRWDEFRELLASYYSRELGRPPGDPVLMLKLEFLRYQHNLSDRQVIERAETDLGFRNFLRIPLRGWLPDPSSLCVFRGRLGVEGFRQVFTQVIHLAREQGIVKDRLRIKDATHVIADFAVPSALALVAQTRDHLLAAAAPFAPLLVEGERVNLELLRTATQALPPAERLATRIDQLREMLRWCDELAPPESAAPNRAWQTFVTRRELAHKILTDQEHPEQGDRTLSAVDPDARYGKHGKFFNGYLLDVSIDANSQLITELNVLPAGGDEAADAVKLIKQEEAAHGNDVQAISIDGVGFHGPVLRALEDPADQAVDAFVPPPQEQGGELFPPSAFVEDREQGVVTCPAGQTSKSHFRDEAKAMTKYRFDAATCLACPLLNRCMKQPPQRDGRTVCKSDYQVEHQRARAKAATPQYAAIRREHPRVERKLGEVMNRHNGRRAHYRGRWKVLVQEIMACLATNVRRLVTLNCAPAAAPEA